MSDALKLDLAREIYPDSKRARKESFTPTQWAGVERAWAWVEKHYQPKEPTVKQEPTIYGAPIIEDKYLPPGHGLVGVNMSAFENPTPPWTEAQRDAARPLWMAHAMGTLTFNGTLEAIAKVAPAFIKGTSVVKISRHYGEAGIDIDVVRSDARSMHVEMIPWSEIDRCRPAPSPAPAGVPDLDECLRTYWLAHSAHESADDPKREAVSAVRDLFVRTRDERIADLEREFDAYTGKVLAALSEWRGPAWDIDEQIRASVRARNELLDAQRTIDTLTKERDEARGKARELEVNLTNRTADFEAVRGLRDREMKDRLDTSKARSVTREELRKMEDAAVNNFGSWSDDLEAALRAVGIEVVG